MSARSVIATLNNNTKETLTLLTATTSLQHGTWITPPPPAIAAGDSGIWEADSDGFATGVEGVVQYQIGQPTQSVSAYFDNPFVGTNQFTGTCVPVNAFACNVTLPTGDNANPVYTLSPKNS
jgi:hypothetical protein